MKKLFLLVSVLGLFISLSNVSHAQNPYIDQFLGVMSQEETSATDLVAIVTSIGGFLIVIGGILAGIAIIVSGLMYMGAGSNAARLASAKALFKNGVIGALILFAAGLIVNTIVLLATNWQQFFS